MNTAPVSNRSRAEAEENTPDLALSARKLADMRSLYREFSPTLQAALEDEYKNDPTGLRVIRGELSADDWLKEKQDARAAVAARRRAEAIQEALRLPINQKAAALGSELVVTPGSLTNVVQAAPQPDYTITDRLADALAKSLKENGPNPIVADIIKDLRNFDINNQSENVVLNSTYFSAYKGVPVVRITSNSGSSFSFGFIGLDREHADPNTVNHEYGHTMQLDERGLFGYILGVAVPSMISNYLYQKGKTDNYYGAPWEAEADKYGNVSRKTNNEPWSEEWYTAYDAYSNYVVPAIEILAAILPYI